MGAIENGEKVSPTSAWELVRVVVCREGGLAEGFYAGVCCRSSWAGTLDQEL